jgi:hypothetical protein
VAAPLRLRDALTRSALVTLANWPVVLIDFAIESLYKTALVIPVAGGAMLVSVVVGGSVRPILADGVRAAAGTILSALANAPGGLASFLLALALVAVGGSVVMFLLKAGTLSVLVAGERVATAIEREPLSYGSLARAHAYDVNTLVRGVDRFGRRMMGLGLWLSGAYGAIGVVYIAALTAAFRLSLMPGGGAVWPLVAATATGMAVIALAAVNLAFDLMRVVTVCDDLGLRRAAGRVSSFLVHDARQVIGIFAVVTGLLALAAAASLLLAASLTLVAWVPVVGFVVVPLQAAAWLVRGLLFQYMGLTAICAYAAQYRRFGGEEAES